MNVVKQLLFITCSLKFCKMKILMFAICVLYTSLRSRDSIAQRFENIKRINMYAIPFSKFTRTHVDSITIIMSNTVERNINKPDKFLKDFSTSIQPREIGGINEFGFDALRMLFTITYLSGNKENILIDVGRSILWRNRIYYASDSTLKIIYSRLNTKQMEHFRVLTREERRKMMR